MEWLVSNKVERTWKKAQFEVLPLHLPAGAEENHNKPEWWLQPSDILTWEFTYTKQLITGKQHLLFIHSFICSLLNNAIYNSGYYRYYNYHHHHHYSIITTFRALATCIFFLGLSHPMLIFSILRSLAVFWHLWLPQWFTLPLDSPRCDYRILFLLRFSLVSLIRPSADVSSPLQSSDFNVFYHICVLT
jgi:hypothetical protein